MRMESFQDFRKHWDAMDIALVSVSNASSYPDLGVAYRFGGNLGREGAVGRILAYYYDLSGHLMVPKVDNVMGRVSKGYDLVYYNQETILGGTELGLSGYPTFNSPQEFGDTMVDLGFNLVSTANNHSLDKGEEGILRSTAYWKKQAENKGVVMWQI